MGHNRETEEQKRAYALCSADDDAGAACLKCPSRRVSTGFSLVAPPTGYRHRMVCKHNRTSKKDSVLACLRSVATQDRTAVSGGRDMPAGKASCSATNQDE
jgi:hypothetical protein